MSRQRRGSSVGTVAVAVSWLLSGASIITSCEWNRPTDPAHEEVERALDEAREAEKPLRMDMPEQVLPQ